jgi:hypothetical protein
MRIISRCSTFFLAGVCLCITPELARAWGNDGHILINRVAAMALPRSMPAFLRKAVDQIAYLGPEPDRWRSRSEPELKQSQEPDHYLNYETIADWGDLPPGRYDFYKKAYDRYFAALKSATTDEQKKDAEKLLPDHIGLQPYITMEVYGRLKAALREYRRLKAAGQPTQGVETAAILYAGWLGHYVADASQPLHASVQYDGWTGPNPNGYTTAKGIHAEFESTFVRDNLDRLQIANHIHPPVKLEHPFHDYMQFLRTSNALAEKVYQLDKTGAFKDKGTAEGLEFASERLASGAQMLLNLWYTAWLESADLEADQRPRLPAQPAQQPPVQPKQEPPKWLRSLSLFAKC